MSNQTNTFDDNGFTVVSRRKKEFVPCEEKVDIDDITLDTPDMEAHFDGLASIVSDITVMKSVAKGRVWTREKLEDFFNYAVEDSQLDDEDRTSYSWVITSCVDEKNPKVLGMVSIHHQWGKHIKPEEEKDFHLTVFVKRDWWGRGVGAEAVYQAIMLFSASHPNCPIYSDAKAKNIGMAHINDKLQAELVGEVKIRKSTYIRYKH